MSETKSYGGHRGATLNLGVESRGPRTTPLVEAIQSKLTHQSNPAATAQTLTDRSSLQQSPEYRSIVASSTANSIADSHNIQQNLPDIELIKQIIIPSILSPNDMMNEELTYTSTDEELGTAIVQSCLEVVRKDCQDYYRIDENLSIQLEDALYNTGSYVEAILPEASIDDIINSGTRVSEESIKNFFTSEGNLSPLGALGNPDDASDNVKHSVTDYDGFSAALGMESHGGSAAAKAYQPKIGNDETPLLIAVTDNLDILKLPKLKDKVRADRLNDIYQQAGFGLETLMSRITKTKTEKETKELFQGGNEKVLDFVRSVYPERTFQMKEVIEVPTRSQSTRSSIGRPLIMKLPSESVIPVHTPSNPAEHIGYFVILDQTGNPIRAPMESDLFENMRLNYNSAGVDMSSYLTSTVNNLTNGTSGEAAERARMTYEESVRIYTNTVEKDLLGRLRNGIYGEELALGKVEETYRIMFARLCEKKHTQLLYLPKTLVSYLAFDYNGYGVGRSLIDKTKMLASLRITLMYANSMAVLKNSITQRTLNVELDDMEQAPEMTIMAAQHAAARALNKANPFGGFDPNNIVQRLTESSVQTSVTGGGGNYPQTKVSMDYSNANYTQIDTAFSDDIRDQLRMGLWVTPEMIDTALGTDFATSIVANNALLAKRTKTAQKVLCKNRTMHIRKICYNDAMMMERIITVIKSNLESIPEAIRTRYSEEEIALYFINTLEVSLPEPDLSKFEMQLEAFKSYSEALDEILPAFINDEMMSTDTTGELSTTIPATVRAIKSYFQRRYLKDNNIMPELFDLVTKDVDADAAINLLDEHKIHMTSIQASVMTYMQTLIAQSKTNDALLNEARGDGEDGGGDAWGGGGSTDNGDDTGGDDTGGDDDGMFGGDDDFSLDEPTDDTDSENTDDAPADDEPADDEPEV